MKTLLLVLRKDLRLLRLPIAVWLAVLAAEVAFMLSRLDEWGGEIGSFDSWGSGRDGPGAASHGGAGRGAGRRGADGPAELPRRVLGHAGRSGSSSCWERSCSSRSRSWSCLGCSRTRSHSPAAVSRAADVLHGLASALLIQGYLVLGLLAVGALTEQFPRAVVALIGLVAWVAAVGWLLLVARDVLLPGQKLGNSWATGALVALATACAVLTSTYRRRPRSAVALAVAGPALALFALFFWPWSFTGEPAPLPASVQLQVVDATRSGRAWVRSVGAERPAEWTAVAAIGTTGLPRGLAARTLHVDASVNWADGRREAGRVLTAIQNPATEDAGRTARDRRARGGDRPRRQDHVCNGREPVRGGGRAGWRGDGLGGRPAAARQPSTRGAAAAARRPALELGLRADRAAAAFGVHAAATHGARDRPAVAAPDRARGLAAKAASTASTRCTIRLRMSSSAFAGLAARARGRSRPWPSGCAWRA